MGRTSCGTGKRFVMCPRYCEIFGPGACAGVFDEKECVMRRAARVDANQQSIVDALRAVGCRVDTLADQGNGTPDLAVGIPASKRAQQPPRIVFIEVKDGSLPPSARALTPAQKRWHAEWAGWPVHVANTVAEALLIVGVQHSGL